jgi:hypothetical protein
MKTIAEVTRKSRNIGCGYTCTVHQTEKGLRVDKVEKPGYVGTYKTVCDKMDADRTLASIRSGGTYWDYQWFIKLKGTWYPIDEGEANSENSYELSTLMNYYPCDNHVVHLSIEVPEDFDKVL